MIHDDELILHYYGDGLDDDARARVEAALRDDPALVLRYLELTAALDRLRMAPDVQPPPAAVRRWQTGLARVARLETADPARRWWRAWPVRAGAAFAALAALAIALHPPSRTGPGTGTIAPPTVSAPAASAHDASALARGVLTHLRETSTLVGALATRENGSRHSALAAALQRNRAYERRAESRDDERLARLLRAFETPLVRLTDTQIDTPAFEAERERLAFELDVVQARLAQSPHRHL